MAESNIQEADILTSEYEAETEDAFQRGGIEELKKLILSKRDEWKSVPVNIAVTGASGVGKSTLINTFRGLTADDEGAAHTDVKEATMEVAKYKHPKNENIVFWDLPGVGTQKFPQITYLKDVQFKKYDVFLVLSVGRCREIDLWLCNEVKRIGKPFYFVRTQMDIEVFKDRCSHPKNHDKKQVVQLIRADCEDNLKRADLPIERVFLIDSCNILDKVFDFDKFSNDIIDKLPSKKKEALTLSLTTLTKGIIQRKKNILLARIKIVALMSAMSGAVPIPGVNALFDAAVTKAEIADYRHQFGLPLCPSADSPSAQSNSFVKYSEVASLTLYIASFAKKVRGMESLSYSLRILGSVTGAVMSYRVTVLALQDILDDISEEAYMKSNELMEDC